MTLNDERVAAALLAGKVGVLPTDTLYGLVAVASNEPAVSKLYSLKQRGAGPGTVIAGDIEQLVALGLRQSYMKPIAHYWPNPISVIIPTHNLAHLHLGKGGLAVRIPKDKALITLLRKTGPLLTSSANHPGEVPAGTVRQAQQYFGDALDFYVDGGDLSQRLPSTIIRVVDDAVEIIRPGAININEKGELV